MLPFRRQHTQQQRQAARSCTVPFFTTATVMLYAACWLGLLLFLVDPSQGFVVPAASSSSSSFTSTPHCRTSPWQLSRFHPAQQRRLVTVTTRTAATTATATTTTRTRTTTTATALSSQQAENGLIKTITVPGQGDYAQLGDLATVKYTCYLPKDDDDDDAAAASSSSSSSSFTLVSQSSRQKVVVGDGTMIDGWDRALRTMRVGERSVIRIVDPTLAYGAIGVPPIVPPHSILELDLELLETQPVGTVSRNIDLDALTIDAQTPTTAAGIAAAFAQRQAAKAAAAAQTPEKEGLDYWIDKARNFYFFGLFEGETGERPPWFLQPSITFPLAFVIVGAAFYLTLAGGAITERGAQVTDELDEIILSLDSTNGGSGSGGGGGGSCSCGCSTYPGGDLLSPTTTTALLAMNGLLTTLLSLAAVTSPPMDHLGL